VVVANQRAASEVRLYVGKTGDNRDGCNPVISRAGNHFSYNDVHSQVRNKLGADPHEFDFEYFYVLFDPYDITDASRRTKVDVINEMERQANLLLQQRLPEDKRVVLMNPYKNARRLSAEDREARARLASMDRMEALGKLIDAAMGCVAGVLQGTANNTMDPAAASSRGSS
jgi:hypothetical protein